MVAYTGGPMRVAGWRNPVIVDLAGLAIPSQNRPIRFSHDMQSGVGHTDAIKIDTGRLLAAGIVSRDTAAAREIVASSRNGFPWQASIGAGVEEYEFIKGGQKVLVNGREFLGPVNVVRRSVLGEISFVDLGADGQTSASVAAMATPLQEETNEMGDNNNVVTEPQPAPAVARDAGIARNAERRRPATFSAGGRESGGADAGGGGGRIGADIGHPPHLRRGACGDRGPGDPRGLG